MTLYSHPHIAHRVRSLTLITNWVDWNIPDKGTLWTRLARNLPFDLGRFIDPLLRTISSVDKCKMLMENTVPNFQNLSSLNILDGSGHFSRIPPDRLLLNVYSSCASNLRRLSLCIKYADFNVFFPPNDLNLTPLEEVALTFYPRIGPWPDAETVSAFFQAIASTLTTLVITFSGGTSDEPLRMLQSFPRQRGGAVFPKLTTFSLFHPVSPASPSSNLMQFLNQHAGTVKHLCLQGTPIAFKSLLVPILPRLESLNILSNPKYRKREEAASGEGLDGALAYVQHSRSTLTSLGLTQCSFTLRDLGTLLDFFGRGSSKQVGGGLKSLTVSVQVLSPHLLDMLAEKLPQLERLKVDFAYLRSADDPSAGGWGDLKQEVQLYFIIPFLPTLTFPFMLLS